MQFACDGVPQPEECLEEGKEACKKVVKDCKEFPKGKNIVYQQTPNFSFDIYIYIYLSSIVFLSFVFKRFCQITW